MQEEVWETAVEEEELIGLVWEQVAVIALIEAQLTEEIVHNRLSIEET